MFHEFGHALHGMFANVEYPALSGTKRPRDFVEFPSQFNEHWALDPGRLRPLRPPLPDRRAHAAGAGGEDPEVETFNQGYALTELLAALTGHAVAHAAARRPQQNVDAVRDQRAARRRLRYTADVPPRYRSSYFAHIWGSGYAAGYYAYHVERDAGRRCLRLVQEHGGLTRANGQRFRDMILSRGNTEDEATMYRAFYGRDPDIEPMLERRGLPPVKGNPGG